MGPGVPAPIVRPSTSVEALFHSLYALWGEPLSEAEAGEACALAASRGMHCLEGGFGAGPFQA